MGDRHTRMAKRSSIEEQERVEDSNADLRCG